MLDTPFGEFLVILTSRQILLSPKMLPNETFVGQRTTELIATIKRLPGKSILQAIVVTNAHQRMITSGHQSLYPSIMVGITLPE